MHERSCRTVAVEDGADDAAVDDAGKRLVARWQPQRCVQTAQDAEALQAQAVRICVPCKTMIRWVR